MGRRFLTDGKVALFEINPVLVPGRKQRAREVRLFIRGSVEPGM
jgi:hypothetical protein